MKTRKHILTAAIASALLLPVTARAGTDITTTNYVPGGYSAASGYLNSVVGAVCFAAGQQNGVFGSYNSIFGFNSVINNGSVASFSVGGGHNITGNFNFVTGYLNTVTAPGQSNFLSGTSNSASGNSSFVGGLNNVSTGNQSFMYGSFLNDGGLAGSVMLSDSNPFNLRTTGARFTNVTPDTFNGSFNRGYFLFTDDGQTPSGAPGSGSAGLFVVPTPANSLGSANPAFVGINVNPPTQALDVAGNGRFTGYVQIDSDGTNSGEAVDNSIRFGGSGEAISSKRTAGGNQNGLDFHTANAPRMSINSAGNVGIGTPLPAAKLHVNQQTSGVPTMILQGGNGFSGQARSGLAFSAALNDHLKHFISTNHVASADFQNKMSFWLNTGANDRPDDTPGNGTVRVMTLNGRGLVGIGTEFPTRGGLHIESTGGSTDAYNPIGVLNTAGAIGNTSTGAGPGASLWAAGPIFGSLFVAFSDERIKDIKGQSDSVADLKTLLGIKVTDYTFKDTRIKGSRSHKKLIAQQVEQVYPQAVSRSVNEVPDIYRNATIKDGWVQLATDLKVGESVKLISVNEQGVHEVLEVRDGAFRTAFQPATDKVFVYGREVKDFRSVDYEAVSMLNVSATQELARKLEAKDAEIAALKKQLAAQAAREKAIEARLARLEQAAPAAVPVKLSLTK